MLLRLAYLGLTNIFALVRLLPRSTRDKDIEFPALRHQIGVLRRQLSDTRVRFSPADRALLATLLHRPEPVAEFSTRTGGDPFDDGSQRMFAYHYYDANANGRQTLSIRPITFSGGWPVMGPPLSTTASA